MPETQMSTQQAAANQVGDQPVVVLLASEDAVARAAIADFLAGRGYQVQQADDGAAAWEAFLQQIPSLVITDLVMPRMGGMQLLQHIHQADNAVPVIVVSGACGVQDVVEALRNGAADYLIKPLIDFHMLQHAIDQCLERTRLLQQNRCYQAKLEKTNQELTAHLRALEQDQQAGRQLQLKLYPQKDVQAGQYHFSHCVLPSLYLSGDFLEYVNLGENFLGFYIADVSGHGVSSAFVTALLRHFSLKIHRKTRNAMLAGNPSPFPTPADAMAYYNKELLAAGIEKFVTIFMGWVDMKNNTLTYSVAGHLPMPILASGDEVRYLEGGGMPVGLLPEAQYNNYTVHLPDTFTLVLCSDGVLEILPANGLIGKEALLLEQIAASDRTQQGIEAQLNLHAVSDAPDDIAVMTLVKTA